jgi:hypothetical protein
MQLFFAVVTIIETLKFGSFGGAKPQKIFRKLWQLLSHLEKLLKLNNLTIKYQT